MVDTTFHHTLLLATIGPLAVVGLIFLFYMFITRVKLPMQKFASDPKIDAEKRSFAATKLKDGCYLLFLGLTYLVFNSVSTTIFKTFQCEHVGDDPVEYLRSDQSIDCDSPGHRLDKIYAMSMILVYPLGITVFYAYVLVKKRRELSSDERDRDTKLIKISFLWEMYKPRYWYFEVIECVRRLIMTGMLVLVRPGETTQVAVAMLFAIISIVLYTHLRPFENPHDNRLAIVSQWAIFFTLFAAMLIKTKVDDEDDYDQTLFGLILVACNCTAFVLAIWQAVIPMTETLFSMLFHKTTVLTESQRGQLDIRGLTEWYDSKKIYKTEVETFMVSAKANGKVHKKLWSELEISGEGFRAYNMALMTANVEEAGWKSIEEDYGDDEDFKYWLNEWLTGAEAHWRCSSPDETGSGYVDQVRCRFPIYQDYDRVRDFFINEDGETRYDEENRTGFQEFRKSKDRTFPQRKLYSVVKRMGASIPVFGLKKREFLMEEWREDMKYQSESGEESDCLLVTARSIRENHIRTNDDTHKDGFERGEMELYSFLLKDCGSGVTMCTFVGGGLRLKGIFELMGRQLYLQFVIRVVDSVIVQIASETGETDFKEDEKMSKSSRWLMKFGTKGMAKDRQRIVKKRRGSKLQAVNPLQAKRAPTSTSDGDGDDDDGHGSIEMKSIADKRRSWMEHKRSSNEGSMKDVSSFTTRAKRKKR